MALGDRTLRRGSSGDDVVALQAFLNHLRYGPLEEDGSYGHRTQEAVRAFQSDHGLVADGIYGPRSNAVLIGILQYNPPIGDTLAKPYVVKAGDTLAKIALWYRISVPEIVQRNNLQNPNVIYVGQILNLSSAGAPLGSI